MEEDFTQNIDEDKTKKPDEANLKGKDNHEAVNQYQFRSKYLESLDAAKKLRDISTGIYNELFGYIKYDSIQIKNDELSKLYETYSSKLDRLKYADAKLKTRIKKKGNNS